MSTRVVKLSEFSKVLGDFSKKKLKEQREAVAKGLARSIPDLVAASPVDTGLYAASWDFTVDEDHAILGNYAPYAGVIEYGARPFTPPIGPLLAWAHRVLRNKTQEDGTPFERGQPRSKEDVAQNGGSSLSGYSQDEWNLAKKAQKAISERGMIPRHIMQNMIPTIIENIRKELHR